MNLLNKEIVQITPYYPPHLGGMENCVREISERLAKKGFKITVLTSNSGVSDANIISSKYVKAYYLKCIEIAHTPICISLLIKLFQISNKALLHIHIANAFFPEVTSLIAKIRNMKYVIHFHIDVEGSGIFGFILPLYKKVVLKRVLLGASQIFCLTESQKNLLIDKYHLKRNLITILPNGVSDQFFINKAKVNHTKSKIRLLYVGRISKQKNIPLLLESFHKLDQNIFELHIVGSGDLMEKMQLYAEELHLENVFWHGKRTGTELVNLYSKADIFILPSENEGMSLSLLEAMASGLPIITTDLPQSRDFVNNGAIFVRNPTPKTFAQAITYLSKNPSIMKDMSANNIMIAKKFSWAVIVNQIIDIYKTLV